MNDQTREGAGDTLKIDEALEFLNKELKGRQDEISRLINEKYSNLKEIISTGKEMMERTKQALGEVVGKGEESVKEMTIEIDKRVHASPWLAVGIAAVGGFFLGYIIEASRRSK